MRIAYVSAHYAPFIGGVEKHVVEIARRAAARGHRVDVLTHEESDAALPARERRADVVVRRFKVPVPSTNFAVSPEMVAYLVRYSGRYDLVHAHGYHALPALWAALTKKSALVFTPHYHGTGHSRFRKAIHPPYRALGGRIFDRAERTIAVAPPESELILSHFPSIRDRLVVIPNGVDLEELRSARPFEKQGNLVLSAGRVETYKQIDKTILSLDRLPPEWSLAVTGGGPGVVELERVTRQAGLEDRVRFLGRVSDEDLHRWFRTADVFVSMSRNEAMPITLIEVLAAGARVVASDIPAHVALKQKTGGSLDLVSVEAGPDEVARAILAAAAQPHHEAQIDTWDDVTDATLELYRDALAQRS